MYMLLPTAYHISHMQCFLMSEVAVRVISGGWDRHCRFLMVWQQWFLVVSLALSFVLWKRSISLISVMHKIMEIQVLKIKEYETRLFKSVQCMCIHSTSIMSLPHLCYCILATLCGPVVCFHWPGMSKEELKA